MKKLLSREMRRERWLDFAKFMESLPKEKFNHSDWCKPDHTCKTTACVAGWGAIRYSPTVKEWLDLTFKRQALSLKFKRTKSLKTIDALCVESRTLYDAIDILSDEFEWASAGMEALYLSEELARKLFYPDNFFWFTDNTMRVQIDATNDDIALVFRYLACLPNKSGVKLPHHFNRESMQKTIDRYTSKGV